MKATAQAIQIHADENDPSLIVIELAGELDQQLTTDLIYQIESRIDRGVRRVVIDCARLQHVSSHDLGALIRIHHRLSRRDGRMKIAGVSRMMRTALEMTRLDQVFEVHPTVASAKEAFAKG